MRYPKTLLSYYTMCYQHSTVCGQQMQILMEIGLKSKALMIVMDYIFYRCRWVQLSKFCGPSSIEFGIGT